MIKYILKRLGLSVIILLGVSVIVYFLVRLMPTDYLENKFSAKLQEGTITQEQLDDFKRKYGLYMPDGFIDLELNGGTLKGTQFRADTKVRKYEAATDKTDFEELYQITYSSVEGNLQMKFEDGRFTILDKSDEISKQVASGAYIVADDGGLKLMETNAEYDVTVVFSQATTWDKFVAVLSGYFAWLGNMLKGDMGQSFIYQKPVGTVIVEHMWISFLISLVALILQFAISIPLGITSATHQYSVRDYTVTVLVLMGISLPSFFFAALLIKLFCSTLGWLPAAGLVSGSSAATGMAYAMDVLSHLVLPMTVLVVLSIGGLMRYTRTNMLEVLNSDYIRTARSKGLSEKKVVYVHAFRNTMIPLMTMMAGILPSLFGGAMITEEVFAIDGIGRLAYKALQQGDIPFIMGYNMFLAVLTVIGTLFSDLMYAVVDPRVKLTK